MFSKKLFEAAKIVSKKVLKVKKDERTLIITNLKKDCLEISQALYEAFNKAGAYSTLMIQPVKSSFDYMNLEVREAIASTPQVICSISHERLGKDSICLKEPLLASDGKKYDSIFNFLLAEKKVRAVWSPGITKRIFIEAVPINYDKLKRKCHAIKEFINKASEVKIQTLKGTDFSFSIKGRNVKVDDGDFSEPGKGGNLPAGEIFISPVVGSSKGVLIIDGSISMEKTFLLKSPIKIEVENGYVKKISGGLEAENLKRLIKKASIQPFKLAEKGVLTKDKALEYSRNAKHIGEFGLGLNDKAKIVGNVLEDEKVLGTIHIAIGSNYDEDAQALIHYDCVIKKPSVFIDGKLLMKNGELMI
jgi:leucyl aminopeptidase (aminopeptidase T)